MLKWLKVLYKEDSKLHFIPSYVKKDILWWHSFLPLYNYNGVYIVLYEEWCCPDSLLIPVTLVFKIVVVSGNFKANTFIRSFETHWQIQIYRINVLEIFAIIVCL